jgi:hypothetical protein
MRILIACLAPAAFTASIKHDASSASRDSNRNLRKRRRSEVPLAFPKTALETLLDVTLQKDLELVTLLASNNPSDTATVDTTSVEKMEKAVTDLVKTADAGTPMADSVKEIQDLITKTMMPKVLNASVANQHELNSLALAVETCKSSRDGAATGANVEKDKYLQASPLHKECRRQEAILATADDDCKKSHGDVETIRDLHCAQLESYEQQWGQQARVSQVIEKAGGETPKLYMKRLEDTFCKRSDADDAVRSNGELTGDPSFSIHTFYEKYVKLERACKEARKNHDSLINGCKEKKQRYKAKMSECDSIQAQMDGAACNRAVLIKDSCENYAECYSSKKTLFTSAVEAARQAEEARKGEWRALKRMSCLIDAFEDGKVSNNDIEECKKKDS